MTRRASFLLFGAAALPLAVLGAGGAAGLRINTSHSMPVGVWRIGAAQTLHRGDVVTVCLPQPVSAFALTRGYTAPGICPNGDEPLVKSIGAVAGDVVTVAPEGLTVNDVPVAHTARLAQDSAGRPLYGVGEGAYRIEAGQVWLIAPANARSFDSRYFGVVPVSSVLGVARPVWVFP